MAKLRKRYGKQIRDELGHFAVWPIGARVALGQIGFFDGRRHEFEWVTSLEKLGVNLPPATPQGVFDEMYTTEAAVQCSFSANPSANRRLAQMAFRRSGALATQGYKMNMVRLDIHALNKVVVPQVISGEIEWHSGWVVITELFQAAGYSALMAGSQGGKAVLSAPLAGSNVGFNIADVSLGIKEEQYRSLSLRTVCKGDATPFFYVHSLVGDKHVGKTFRRYARRPNLLSLLYKDGS